MFWRKNPLLLLLCAFLPGIGTGLHFGSEAWYGPVFFVLGAALPALLFWQWRGVAAQERFLFGACILAWFGLFGHWIALESKFSQLEKPFLPGGSCHAQGVVEEMGPEAEWQRVQVRLQLVRDSLTQRLDIPVMLYLQSAPDLKPGDTLLAQARFEAAQGPLNPEVFDYSAWLRKSGIYMQAFVRPGQYSIRPARDGSGGIRALRSEAIDALRGILPDKASFGVGAALILGYRNSLDGDLREAYRDAGAMHVLAVSGMHVGLVYLLLGYVLLPLSGMGRLARALTLLTQLTGLWVFVGLAGAPISAIRAGIMFTLFSIGRLGRRRGSPHNTLALAAMAILCVRPSDLFDIGFQLSFLAVGGIITFKPALDQLVLPRGRLAGMLWQLISVSLAAQLATAPLCLFYFHQWPVYFFISGLVAVPAASCILCVGLLALATHSLYPVGDILGAGLHWLIRGLNGITLWIADLPGAAWQGIWLNRADLWAWLILLLCLAILCVSRQTKWLLPILASLAVCILLQSMAEISSRRQRLIAIYSARDATLIDFVDGKKIITLVSEDLDVEEEERVAGLFRRSRRAAKEVEVNPGQPFREGRVWMDGSYIRFDACRLGFRLPLEGAFDVLVVARGSKVDHRALGARPPAWIVLDGSLDYRAAERWRQRCEDLGVPCTDVKSEGALILGPDLSPIEWR